MKFFPIKVAIICIFVTPVLYIFSLTSCEDFLTSHYSNQIENVFVGETHAILDGSIQLEEQVAKNIQTFFKDDWIINKLNLDIDVQITTKKGRVIYPIFMNINFLNRDINENLETQDIANNNYALLSDGLTVNVKIRLNYSSYISLFLLGFYFAALAFVVLIFYRIGSRKAAKERQEKSKQIVELQSKEKDQKKYLEKIKNEKQALFDNIESLNTKYQKNKTKAKENEEDLFDEIISLETKLNAFIELKQKKESEIDDLKSKIKKYERRKGSKFKRVDYDFMGKRFVTLYKNIIMNRKALSGFLNLNDDQQIKAEEIILLLDRSPNKVTIKRKVFSGKKHKNTSFEVLFAYNGRLYFDKDENNKTRILVIGTKNTQQKDMDFLHNL